MNLLLKSLACLLMATLTVLLYQVSAYVIPQAQETLARTEKEVWLQGRDLERTQADIRRAVGETSAALPLMIAELHVARVELNERLTEFNNVLAYTSCGLVGLPEKCGQFGSLYVAAGALEDAAEETAQLERQLSEEIGKIDSQFLECSGNPGCVYSRWLAMSGEAMRTMDSLRRVSKSLEEAAPQLAESAVQNSNNLEQITENVETFTNKVVAPRPWWRKVVDVLVTSSFFAVRILF